MAISRGATSTRRRVSGFFNRHPRLKLGFLLGPPMGWMLVVYLGALTILFLSAFWRQNPLTAEIERIWGLGNFRDLLSNEVYRQIALRTAGIALAVTLADIVLAFPIAYYAARIARPRVRTLILLAVVLPLWSSYLARVYAWRVILSGNGVLNSTLNSLGLGSLDVGYSNWAIWIVFTYLWLPFVALPIYASLERLPNSYMEASADLGAKWWTTLRRVVLPIALPGIVAGSIFSFSLTLGDYIVPSLVGNTFFIGNVVYTSVGVANNIPFAAAYALVPVAIMGVYLAFARRLGAFEAL
ncbi:MAG TPA: ABC transporter permease [Actinomycetota bacterium]|nr:ABC transporter permease [Actinomycetota bacterium]